MIRNCIRPKSYEEAATSLICLARDGYYHDTINPVTASRLRDVWCSTTSLRQRHVTSLAAYVNTISPSLS